MWNKTTMKIKQSKIILTLIHQVAIISTLIYILSKDPTILNGIIAVTAISVITLLSNIYAEIVNK